MSRHSASPARMSPLDTLELFVARADELSRMRIIRTQGLGSEWSVSTGVNRPTTFRSVQPDEEDLRSYLLTFRRFVSQSDPIHIEYVHGLCRKHFTSDGLLAHVNDCQRGWKESVLQSGIKLIVNGREVKPAHIADLWINGHYFHDDPTKAAELRRYIPDTILFVRQEFLNFVVEATRVIGGTGYTIKMALRDGAVRN